MAALRSAFRGPAVLLLPIVAIAVLAPVARGVALPPLDWDGMTYHLVHAGRWVQSGGRPVDPAPDAWTYYEYFPIVGDMAWAWAMLPWSSDLGVAPMAAAFTLVLALAVAALGRELGAPSDRAVMAGLAAIAVPSTLRAVASCYVDIQLAVYFTLATLFLARFWRDPRPEVAALALGASGLALGVKLSGIPAIPVALAVIAVRCALGRDARPLIALPALALGTPTYLRAWIDHGQPLWPQGFAPLGLKGSSELALVQGPRGTLSGLPRHLFFKLTGGEHHLNLGPGLIPALLLAVVGLWLAWRDRRHAAVVAGLMSAVFLAMSFTAAGRSHLAMSGSGRFLLPVVAVLLAASARVTPRWLGLALVVFQLVYGKPVFGPVDARVTLIMAAVLVGGVALTGIATTLASRAGAAAALATGIAVATLAGLPVIRLRDAWRTPMYEAAATKPPIYIRQPLDARYLTPRVWDTIDDGVPHTIAYTAGYSPHNWFRYPLLGDRLEHRLVYVPITKDGSTVNYRKAARVAEVADPEAWLGRVLEMGVDRVVLGVPAPPERPWIVARPDCFELLAEERKVSLWAVRPGCDG